MCSDPKTFPNPETGEVVTVACRVCDDCIATRRHGWVARAMAEKSCHDHCLCIALTYNNDTQENRDSAAMFAYRDVNAFLKRLRAAARRSDRSAYLRFLCAGEQGDRNGRCHWHMILYSNVDLLALGVVSLRDTVLTDPADMFSVGKKKIRLNWSLWGRGFVTFQKPDQGAMNYVLSYCLKDQFTQEKSQGTMRYARSENFATGLFRMSKYPPIGRDWLMRKLEGLNDRGAVLPSLNLVIPGFRGFWYPSGGFRQKLLWGLVALNKRVLWATGANAPQWSSLLSSCAENENDMDILNAPPQQIDVTDPDYTSLESEIAARGRETAGYQRLGEFRRKCGGPIPCRDCLDGLHASSLVGLGLRRIETEDGFDYHPTETGFAPETTGGINPHCFSRGSKIARLAFPGSAVETVRKDLASFPESLAHFDKERGRFGEG
jgi:hypothetical protein